MSTTQPLKTLFFLTIVTGFSLISLLFIICCAWIGFDVKTHCQNAKQDYPSAPNCTQALISLLQDNKQSFRSRNSAIWALGQLGDSQALPVLQGFYTGNIPPREPLNGAISQYELKKAIELTSGGTNLTAVFWRYGL